MKYLLILLVLAMALAPLVNFLPSGRQRRQARLREYAAVHGLFVEFRELPGGTRPAPPSDIGPGQAIYYGRRLPPSRGEPRPRRAWGRDGSQWRGIGHREPAPQAAAAMPPCVPAIGVDEGSCGAFWMEAGEEAEVAAIVAALAAWEGDLRAP